ncbi:unnamed protein product [Mycena citricolor]|uniref:Fibronectin type-III domain-containing protein n=1 Tax=Mycena citricolor TaxID=2018698 RepID=A0AAD2K0Q6_9AGAR|nr:unnamed protein product [Mycena citricolor]
MRHPAHTSRRNVHRTCTSLSAFVGRHNNAHCTHVTTRMGEQFAVVLGLGIGHAVTFRSTQDSFAASPRPRIGNHLSACYKRRDAAFWALQDEIVDEFGVRTPEPPKLQLPNVTQMSVTLEWLPIKLATAELRLLDLYRNGQRLAPIPNPTTNTSSKFSGLELDTEYTFQLTLRTTAGRFPSELLHVHTHTRTETSGRAVQLSMPIVQSHWIFAHQSERRSVPIALFGLGATPPNALPSRRPQSMSAASPTQRSPVSAAAVRQSMPLTVSPIGQPATFVGQSVRDIPPPTVPVVAVEDAHLEDEESDVTELEAKQLVLMEKRASKTGTMDMQFKFPPTSPTSPSPEDPDAAAVAVEPLSIEVSPPPVVEKETVPSVRTEGEVDDNLGETEDIPL